jgi:hypothetical protein
MKLHICSVLWSIHNPLSPSVGPAAHKEATTAPSNSTGSGRCLLWFSVWTSNTSTMGLWGITQFAQTARTFQILSQLLVINSLNAELNSICHLLALLGTHHILHVSRIKVNYPHQWTPTACSAAKFLTQTITQPAHLQESSVHRSHQKKYFNLLFGVRVRDVIHWNITCMVFLSINKLMLIYLLLDQCHFPHCNSHTDWPGIEPGLPESQAGY